VNPTEFSCPICRRQSEPANQIFVCAPCHGDLIARGQVALTSTAEFAAMTPARAAEILGRVEPSDAEPTGTAGASCSWCGKAKKDARKILSNGNAHICEECVALCSDILTAELGDDWR